MRNAQLVTRNRKGDLFFFGVSKAVRRWFIMFSWLVEKGPQPLRIVKTAPLASLDVFGLGMPDSRAGLIRAALLPHAHEIGGVTR